MFSFTIACILYAGVAITGFLMFGDSTISQFTLNLPSNFTASNIAGWTVFVFYIINLSNLLVEVVAPITKYALTITPVALGLEELLRPTMFGSYGVSLVIRSVLVISTMIVAITVPYFGTIMAFIGSLLVMLVVASCFFIIIVGVVCAVIGTYAALSGISDQKAILLG
ncbi:hypothetical protein Leryth_025631 [Lithospermum erythrorhizon]|nr:hypothetical protein Leryth_025631 [Lithospermum erythrorhizon]